MGSRVDLPRTAVGRLGQALQANEPGFWGLDLMGRLKPDASYDQALASLNGTFQTAALEVMPPPRHENEAAQLNTQVSSLRLSSTGEEERGNPRLVSVVAASDSAARLVSNPSGEGNAVRAAPKGYARSQRTN